MTDAEQALCQESAQAAQHATEVQEAMDKQVQAQWRQAEAELRDLCKSNSAQAQTLASKLHETQLEHQQISTAQERQLQLGNHNKRNNSIKPSPREHELAILEFHRQAEEQPEILKSQWRMQLSQQASYKAEIHEL